MPGRADPLIQTVAAAPAVTRLAGRIEEGILETSRGAVSLTGAPPGLFPFLLEAVGGPLGLKWAVLFAHERDAASFARDATSVLGAIHVALFPAPVLSPYQGVAPSLKVRRDEFGTLQRLASGEVRILVVPARALLRALPSPGDFAKRTRRITAGDHASPARLVEGLLAEGYARVDLVTETGDVAVRGGLLDVFPPHRDEPVRIEFDDAVASLRSFDPDTQRSTGALAAVDLPPMALTPDTRDTREAAQRVLAGCRTADDDPPVPRDLSLARRNDGLEEILPLLDGGDTVHILDHAARFVVAADDVDAIGAELVRAADVLSLDYAKARSAGRVVPDAVRLTGDAARVAREIARRTVLALAPAVPSGDVVAVGAESVVTFEDRLPDAPKEISRARRDGLAVVLSAQTKGEREHVERLLVEYEVDHFTQAHPDPDSGGHEGAAPLVPGGCRVLAGGPRAGFLFRPAGLLLLTATDLFGEPRTVAVRRKSASEAFLSDLRDLNVGDIVVHRDYGLGRFAGLASIDDGSVAREMVDLRYAGDTKLLVPVERLDLIQKYASAGDGPSPPLDRLGGAGWEKRKSSVKKAVKDIADQLVKLYARRAAAPGHGFSKDSPWQKEFEDAFEYVETPDQAAAIRDVKRDMESEKPMDRLLCGDVGYGKTEVAMRAIFKCVLDGKQAAFLAPTTILADQHFRTLKRRFAAFPVSLDILSRFRSKEEQQEVLRRLAEGTLDVVVGTHRILSKDVRFKDLGLLVVDEEQRFGVAQKERIKEWRAWVDVLAMSATPIPRSLHLSLAGIRDLSVIETPPKDRLAIDTHVVVTDDAVIGEAIRAEVDRGGQVFVVHNRIDSLGLWREKLAALVPHVRVVTAHGQMSEGELERAMRAFVTRAADVLLATTIVENGLDIPSANTMLIDRADLYGLSQLYQLRGRVGRSDKAASCWLLVPPGMPLSDDARRRLRAIQEFSDLGAGFRIAAKDLEIRGAGNILGGEQSGHIESVGFETYVNLLEEAMAEMKGEPLPETRDVTLQIGIPLALPATWIPEESLRMALYKRIAAAPDEETLEREAAAASDRYGAAPPAFTRLLELAQLRLLARSLGVRALQRRGDEMAATLEKNHALDTEKVVALLRLGELVASGPDAFRIPKAFAGVSPENLASHARGVLVSLAARRPVAAGAA
ncbi:MAG: transcription-repair coupling factor [Thermoanaerobaculia bacterium]